MTFCMLCICPCAAQAKATNSYDKVKSFYGRQLPDFRTEEKATEVSRLLHGDGEEEDGVEEEEDRRLIRDGHMRPLDLDRPLFEPGGNEMVQDEADGAGGAGAGAGAGTGGSLAGANSIFQSLLYPVRRLTRGFLSIFDP